MSARLSISTKASITQTEFSSSTSCLAEASPAAYPHFDEPPNLASGDIVEWIGLTQAKKG
jgi:hypothetical protein